MWYGALFAVFLLLMGTVLYVCQDPSGLSAGPFIMQGLFVIAFGILAILSTVDAARWAGAVGYGLGAQVLFVMAAWLALGMLWTVLFRVSDPNYHEWLLLGRVLFTAHSILLFVGNHLWLMSCVRAT